MPAGLMFHHFHDERDHPPGQGSISTREFESMIHFIGRENILDAEIWAEAALRSPTSIEGKYCITFDDALLCQYDIAKPVLDRLGIKAFWFVYSSIFEGNVERLEVYRSFRMSFFDSLDAFHLAFYVAVEASGYKDDLVRKLSTFRPSEYLREFPFYTDDDRTFRYVRDKVLKPERYQQVMDRMIADRGTSLFALREKLWMRNAELKKLRDEGHVIGLHSFSHPTELASLPLNEKQAEYRLNFQHLEKVLGEKPRTMSHPCNSYDSESLAVLRELGIEIGFRSNMSPIPNPTSLEFPRQDHANLKAMMSGLTL